MIFFECFEAAGFYLTKAATLALFSAGRSTGLTVDIGDERTRIVPIYEGYALPTETLTLPIGASTIRSQLESQWISQNGYSYRERVVGQLRKVVETKAFAHHADSKLNLSENRTCKLPDGTELTLSGQQISSAVHGALFGGDEKTDIAAATASCIRACDEDIRIDLSNNVILSGAAFQMEGLPELYSQNLKVHNTVRSTKSPVAGNPAERAIKPWVGGSIISSLETSSSCFITRQEYEEAGPAIVHRKCF